MSIDLQNTTLALAAVAALALLVQTIGMIVVLTMARKAAKNMREELEEYRSLLMPVIQKAREVVENVAPKIERAAEDLSVITASLREQTADIQKAADDIIVRTQRQAGRVDHMLTVVFDGVERAATFMSETVAKPMRQVSGLIASVKAVVETLRDPESTHRYSQPSHSPSRYADGEPISSPRPTGSTTPIRP